MNPSLIALPDGEVHLWFLFAGEEDESLLLEAAHSLLDPGELARLHHIRLPEARKLFLAGRLLVRTGLTRYARRSPADWRFVRNRDGKPEIDPLTGQSDLNFNLAHTAGTVLLAVAKGRAVGADVERRDRTVRASELIRRYFSPGEADELGRLPPDLLNDRFFLYWTLKEAYIKALGRGLAHPLDSFTFSLAGERPFRIDFSLTNHQDLQGWRFALVEPRPRSVAALAVAYEPETVMTIRCFRASPSGGVAPLSLPVVGLSQGVTSLSPA